MSSLREQFERDGYVIIRGLLGPEEAAHYRAEIQALSRLGDADYTEKSFACPDGVSLNREFWPLIYHERLLGVIRDLLGPGARYTQHSDLHAHRGVQSWHRDSAYRTFGEGPDWDESRDPYQVARVAIYLQSHAESGSALGVIPGSHRHEERLTGLDKKLWLALLSAGYHARRLGARLRGAGPVKYNIFSGMLMRTRPGASFLSRPANFVWVDTEPGDCVIFNQRIYHTGSKIEGPKYSVFLSYSPDNEHGRRHVLYYRRHRGDLRYGPIVPELAEELKQRGLYLDVEQELSEAPLPGSAGR